MVQEHQREPDPLPSDVVAEQARTVNAIQVPERLVEPPVEHRAALIPVALAGTPVEAPDVIGLEMVDALRDVRLMGLRLAASIWETKVGPWGMVLSQHPTPGASVRPRSWVQVIVAGRPHAPVPDIRGIETGSALDAVRRSGLVPLPALLRSSRSVPQGHVITTQPRAGTLVVLGADVSVVVSAGCSTRRDMLSSRKSDE